MNLPQLLKKFKVLHFDFEVLTSNDKLIFLDDDDLSIHIKNVDNKHIFFTVCFKCSSLEYYKQAIKNICNNIDVYFEIKNHFRINSGFKIVINFYS